MDYRWLHSDEGGANYGEFPYCIYLVFSKRHVISTWSPGLWFCFFFCANETKTLIFLFFFFRLPWKVDDFIPRMCPSIKVYLLSVFVFVLFVYLFFFWCVCVCVCVFFIYSSVSIVRMADSLYAALVMIKIAMKRKLFSFCCCCCFLFFSDIQTINWNTRKCVDPT